MQRHDEVCPFDNPFRDRLHFAFGIDVKAGRMARVALARAGHGGEAGGEPHDIPAAQWPRELTAYLVCLSSLT